MFYSITKISLYWLKYLFVLGFNQSPWSLVQHCSHQIMSATVTMTKLSAIWNLHAQFEDDYRIILRYMFKANIPTMWYSNITVLWNILISSNLFGFRQFMWLEEFLLRCLSCPLFLVLSSWYCLEELGGRTNL